MEAQLDNKDYFESEIYQRHDAPRIPLKTHRVWITNSMKGTEMLDSIGNNQTFLNEIVRSNQVLDDDNHKWTHYFWTNDVKAIPRTVAWFKQNGFIVKELRELSEKAFDKTLQRILKDYQSERFGAAADIARFAILLEEGGFYKDMDFFVY